MQHPGGSCPYLSSKVHRFRLPGRRKECFSGKFLDPCRAIIAIKADSLVSFEMTERRDALQIQSELDLTRIS